jgi:DNA polymerase III subunit chi
MSAEWWFYHIERTSLEAAIGPLLEKCLERRWRVVVAARPETLAQLDAALWTWRDDSFLPHGLAGADPGRQPVLLAEQAAPANGARVALLLDGLDADAALFERCIVVFHGSDAEARGAAREQYRKVMASGGKARYFQQDASGGWAERTQGKS